MGELIYQRTIVGYHGCDAEVAANVLLHDAPLSLSENDYDWLGKGIYFWEQGPQRAIDWAKAEAKRSPHKIRKPAVLGAYIHLGQCFDLLDVANTNMLRDMHAEFVLSTTAQGKSIPENQSVPGTTDIDNALRRLDCALINWSLDQLAKAGRSYQTVRGVFTEGTPAYLGAGFMLKSHIQVAVRDPSCILGFFRPNPTYYLP
jgi:hypothetical protein